jgi:hypothetical protein
VTGPTTAARLRGDLGVVGGVEVLPFGVLMFVVGSLLVANAWAVVDARFMVTSAAREAARAYVEAPDQTAAARGASTAVTDVVRNYGRDPQHGRLDITTDGGRSFGRCVRVVLRVSYRVPALVLPWIGGYGHGFDAVADHSEIVDPYRADLPGAVAC